MAGIGRLSEPFEKRLGCLELLLNLIKTADTSLQEEKPMFFGFGLMDVDVSISLSILPLKRQE